MSQKYGLLGSGISSPEIVTWADCCIPVVFDLVGLNRAQV